MQALPQCLSQVANGAQVSPAMVDRIDAFRQDLLASYREAGAENGEGFTPACTHESLYDLTTPTDDIDHASYTAMCRAFGCHEFLAVVEYRTERPNEYRVLAGAERALAQKAWMSHLAGEQD